MAERRMFSLNIVDSDAFVCMPHTAQSLYFHLCMRADDDGFINGPLKITRMIGTEEPDLQLLIDKRFILSFDSGVVVIKHWRIHNKIRKDRHKETMYIEEYQQLEHKENGAYTALTTNRQPNDNQTGAKRVHRLGKVRLVKVRLGKESISKEDDVSEETVEPVICKYKDVFDYYQTLDLIHHRAYTPAMTKAIKKAEKELNCDTEHLKTLLDRHVIKVNISKGCDFETKPRPLTEFFGQKKYESTELICSEYDVDNWKEPTKEMFMSKKHAAEDKPKNSFHNFDTRETNESDINAFLEKQRLKRESEGN